MDGSTDLGEASDVASAEESELSTEQRKKRKTDANTNTYINILAGKVENSEAKHPTTVEIMDFWDNVLTHLQTEDWQKLAIGQDSIPLPLLLTRFRTNRSKTPSYLPGFLYVRECYIVAYNQITKYQVGFRPIISGLPGVGKSVFGIYFILRQLWFATKQKTNLVVLLCGDDDVPGLIFGIGTKQNDETIIRKTEEVDRSDLQCFMRALNPDGVTMMPIKDPCRLACKLSPDLFGWKTSEDSPEFFVVCDPGMFQDHSRSSAQVSQVNIDDIHTHSQTQMILYILSDENKKQVKLTLPCTTKASSKAPIHAWAKEECDASRETIVTALKVPQLNVIEGCVEGIEEHFKCTKPKGCGEQRREYDQRKEMARSLRPFRSLLELIEEIAKKLETILEEEEKVKTFRQRRAKDPVTAQAFKDAHDYHESQVRVKKSDFLDYRFLLIGGEAREWFVPFGKVEEDIITYLKYRLEPRRQGKDESKSDLDKFTRFRQAPQDSLLYEFNVILEHSEALHKQYKAYLQNYSNTTAYLDLEILWSMIWTSRTLGLEHNFRYAFEKEKTWFPLRLSPAIFTTSNHLGGSSLKENFSNVDMLEGVYYNFSFSNFKTIDALGITKKKIFGRAKGRDYKVLLFQTTGSERHTLEVKHLAKLIEDLTDYVLPKFKPGVQMKQIAFYYVVNCGIQEDFHFTQSQVDIRDSVSAAILKDGRNGQDLVLRCVRVMHKPHSSLQNAEESENEAVLAREETQESTGQNDKEPKDQSEEEMQELNNREQEAEKSTGQNDKESTDQSPRTSQEEEIKESMVTESSKNKKKKGKEQTQSHSV